MSVKVNSGLEPRTTGYALVDDGDVAGGLHSVADVTARDAIPDYVLKVGMLVYTESEDKHWKLTQASPTVVWEEFIPPVLPSQTGNTGKVLGTDGSVTSWVDPNSGLSPFEVVTGNAAISAGALIKVSATAGRYETLGAADSASLMVGAAKTSCAGAASTFEAYFISGVLTPLLSDGTGTIPVGSPVEPSTTVAGRVKAGSTNLIGYNVGALVAATLNAAVSVR
jgi:hypothetical protein